jgi:hypothetical protein
MSPAVPDVMRWIRRRPDASGSRGQARLAEILANCPHLDDAANSVSGFTEMMCADRG